MINNKKELQYYLECDRVALGIKRKKPFIIGDDIWKFQITMSRLDYLSNSKKSLIKKILMYFYKYKYRKISLKLGFTIPISNIGPGLAIVHYGNIIISEHSLIGKNFRIHSGVNIGATGGQIKAARIGDNVYIGPGAKIVGEISIGDNVCIGANAVVVNDIQNDITIGGIPAVKISDKNTSIHLIKATEIIANTVSHDN